MSIDISISYDVMPGPPGFLLEVKGGGLIINGVPFLEEKSDALVSDFIKEIDHLEVWRWKRKLHNKDVLDGTYFTMTISNNKRHKWIYKNEFPKNFEDLLSAINNLSQGELFYYLGR
ncbi:hypothetical protein N9W39_01825 [Alphaproteobacteria bacterium]|nr:hypothetical protein [Alphaproteobacteria bacterium]